MPETNDFQPESWQGQETFAESQRRYQEEAEQRRKDAEAKSKKEVEAQVRHLLPKSISTESENPNVIIWDGTSSTGDTPAILYSKMSYYHNEVKAYRGPKSETSFGSFGDILNSNNERSNEKFPLQARPFAKGAALRTRLDEIIIERGGGGQRYESIELILLYYARNAQMPNVPKNKRAPLILMTDERARDHVTPEGAALVHTTIRGSILSTSDIFRELNEKFSVYVVLQPYHLHADEENPANKEILQDWQGYLPPERIAHLEDPRRIVDIFFGILAKESDMVNEFWKELRERQTPEQVEAVKHALRTVLPFSENEKKESSQAKNDVSKKVAVSISDSKMHQPLTGADAEDLL